MLSVDILSKFEQWSTDPFFDEKTRQELLAIKGEDQEIEDRFYKSLEFGTGGLRGVIGAGTNRMNTYTVALATEGFARYIDGLEHSGQKSIVISYDSRHFSKDFAMVCSLIFANHGIKVHLSDEMRPTPMLSFAVRHFKAQGGVMITASHNPPQYNGYKAYGEDGGQFPPEAADVVISQMESIEDIRSLELMDQKEAFDKGLIEYFGSNFDDIYISYLTELIIDQEAIKKKNDIKIVYTPLHGAGHKPVVSVLKAAGFSNILTVEEQCIPDPNFSTVEYPNPEEAKALKMAIDLARKEDCDLVVATDPDGDRMGVAVRDPGGEFKILTGNQIGLLLMDYILSAKRRQGILSDQSFAVTTIVSTRLTKNIAREYGIKLFEVLTGFKFIAEKIKDYDENGSMSFEFAFEESFGYLAGKEVRDKDAVVSVMLISEMAAVAALESKTLYDLLADLFQKYGYAVEKTLSINVEGKEGLDKLRELMAWIREEKPRTIGSTQILAITDYLNLSHTDFVNESSEPIDFDKSNVLIYSLEGDDWFGIRPSGTEPKLKIYFGAYARSMEEAQVKLDKYHDDVNKYIGDRI